MSERLFDDFGKPAGQDDVARSEDVLSDLFVSTPAIEAFLAGERETHAVYGPKGCGKSLLLFKKAVGIRQKTGVLCAPSRQYAYSPSAALGHLESWAPWWFLADADGAPKQASWVSLWTWALYASVLLHWRAFVEWDPVAWREKAHAEPRSAEFVREGCLPSFGVENPYDLLSRKLVELADATRPVRDRALNTETLEFKRLVEKYANFFPPTYLFLDNQDDLYEDNPGFWIASGAGCFRALREVHQVSQKRIHVFLSLRSEVVDELRKSAHFPQWLGDLFEVRWRDEDLLRVFESRARSLKQECFESPEVREVSPWTALFGVASVGRGKDQAPAFRVPSVEAGRRQRSQPITQYLLHRTLGRPRDLIVLGNAILDARRSISSAESPSIDSMRKAIEAAASGTIGRGYLAEVRDRWPWQDRDGGKIEQFVSRHLAKNVLSHREALEIRFAYARQLALRVDEVDPIGTLCRLGLIGWPVQDTSRRGGQLQRFSGVWTSSLIVPGGVNYYLVHPVLYGDPFHVQTVKGVLVGPGLPFGYEPSKRFDSCFISYGSPDEEWALQLHGGLTAAGLDCWCHPCNATPGERVWPEIERALNSMDRMLCVCSAEALRQQGFLDEVARRVKDRGGDGIIPIALDDAWRRAPTQPSSPAALICELLSSRNPVRLRSGGLPKAIEEIKRLLQRPRPSRRNPTAGLGERSSDRASDGAPSD